MEVYFDNSATTRCYDSVKDIVVKTMTEDFGNPSAMHLKGVDAEKYVKESAKTIAGILKVQEKEILFTSGGTELPVHRSEPAHAVPEQLHCAASSQLSLIHI